MAALTYSSMLAMVFCYFVFQEVDAVIIERPPPYIIADSNAPVELTFRDNTSEPDFFIPTATDCNSENTSLISSGECQTPKDRFTCTVGDTEQQYSVVIKRSLPEDAGTYVTRSDNGVPGGDKAFTELVVLSNRTELHGSETLVSWTVCGNAALDASCAGQTAETTSATTEKCKDYSLHLDEPQQTTDVTCSMALTVSSKCTQTTNTVHWNTTITVTLLVTQSSPASSCVVLRPTAVVCVLLSAFITAVTHYLLAAGSS